MIESNKKIPVHPERIRTDNIHRPSWDGMDVEADVLRLDLVDPVISGNKWFKLEYYLRDAIAKGCKRIITYGGAWSNHLLATAAACKYFGIASLGIIRGEEPATWSSTLQQAREYGMEFQFVSREAYRSKQNPDGVKNEGDYVIPEGGYGMPGVKGAANICTYFNPHAYSHICCATGTGTMTAGLISGIQGISSVCAISVLKNDTGCADRIKSLLDPGDNSFQVIDEFPFGGYAKYNPALISFMNEFYSTTGIPTDIVYTAKLFYALDQLILRGYFPPGSKILTIHSGGLQGNSSLENGTLIW